MPGMLYTNDIQQMQCDSGSSSVIILFGVYGYCPIAFIEVVSNMADLIKEVRYLLCPPTV